MVLRLFLTLAAILTACRLSATVMVTENPVGTVTIAVDGAAGQIGAEVNQWGNISYEYASAITATAQTMIKNAQNIIISGPINAADIKALVVKNQANNNWALNSLDMGSATIATIKVDASGPWNVNSHDFLPNNYTKIDVKSLTLPVAADGILPNYFGAGIAQNLTSVRIPAGYTTVGDYAFSGKTNLEKVVLPSGVQSIGRNAFDYTALTHITLPNTLLTIGDQAFVQTKLTAIAFPRNMQSIGDQAFVRTYLRDVYFLGLEAPTVGPNTFDDATYKGNGGFQPTNYSAEQPIGDTEHGYAERRNYMNGQVPFGVMHLRSDLTNEQRAKYMDITRNYEVIRPVAEGKYRAFYDLYYGKMMVWPGQYSYDKTYKDAEAGKLWNGIATYDAAKYMGLHKFSLNVSNVHQTDTENWLFGKKGQQWWTICVPFNMTKAQVRATFGENTEVCKLSTVVRNKEKRTITLKFQDNVYASAADADVVIAAHVAYMIFPTVAPTVDISFSGYQLEEGSPLPTIVNAAQEGALTETARYTYRFIGNYLSQWDATINNGMGQPIVMPQYTYFLGNNNGRHQFFYQMGITGKWNPYSATVQAFNADTSSAQTFAGEDDSFLFEAGAKVTTFFGHESDGTTTAVQLPTTLKPTHTSTYAIYNLQGQRVAQDTETAANLPAGLYIVNGKKIMKR